MERSADTELRELLERLHDTYNRPEFIPDDPISVPHRFTDRADREIAGFFAATIAWGNRRTIVRNGHRMMRLMDDAPADFVRNASAGAFNFTLAMWLVSLIGWILTFTIIGAIVGVPMILIGAFGSIVLGIVGAIKSWNGESYTYPWQLKVLN